MINVSICLSDIPKEAITKSEKNGKSYCNIIVDERKQVGNYGETHTVAMSQSKEQREAKEPKIYVGSGKEFKFEQRTESRNTSAPTQHADCNNSNDGLPF